MPTYVYRFRGTDAEIEAVQDSSDPDYAEMPDPETGEMRPVRRVFTPVCIAFKGEGFYRNDSRKSR